MAQTNLMNEQEEVGVENDIVLDSALKKRGKITTEDVAPATMTVAALNLMPSPPPMSPSSLSVNLRDGLTVTDDDLIGLPDLTDDDLIGILKDLDLLKDEKMGLSPANHAEVSPDGLLTPSMKVDSSIYDGPPTNFQELIELPVELKQNAEVTDISLLCPQHLNHPGPETHERNFGMDENESKDGHVLQSTANDHLTSSTCDEEGSATPQSQNTECTEENAGDSRMEEESPSSFSASGAGSSSEVNNPKKRKRRSKNGKAKKAKTFREHGKPYLGKSIIKATGKVEPKDKEGRKLGKRCSCTVDNKGRPNINKCSSFDEEERQSLLDQIWSMTEDERRVWISSVVDISGVKKKTVPVENNSRRSNTMVYYLYKNEVKVKVCKTFFLQTTGLRQWWVREWALRGKDSNPPPGQNTSDTTKYEEERQPPQTPAPAEEKCPKINKISEKDEPHDVPSSTVKVVGGRETVTERDKPSTSYQLE